MNLVSYKARFKNLEASDKNIGEVNGYLAALSDVLDYIKELTEFKPEKRMIDAVNIIEAIGKTTKHIGTIQQEFVRKLQGGGETGIATEPGFSGESGKVVTEEDLYEELKTSEIL